MIYASLNSFRAWCSRCTLPGYLVLSALSGAVLLNLLLQAWALPLARPFAWAVLVLLAAGAAVKLAYWRDVDGGPGGGGAGTSTAERSEEHTSELQSLMRISYAVFCL